MTVIGAPLLGCIAIDWLPDLLGTGGTHRPVRFVEFEAGRLELETDGPDAESALDALSELIARRFDEEA